MNYKKLFVKLEYVFFIVNLGIGSFLTYISIYSINISNQIVFFILLGSIFISFILRIKNGNETKKLNSSLLNIHHENINLKKAIEDLNIVNEDLTKEINSLSINSNKASINLDNLLEKNEELNLHFKNLENKNKNSLKFLKNLLNNSLIKKEDLLEHISSKKLIQIFCFATGFPIVIENNKKKEIKIKRRYLEFLSSFGFIRMGQKRSSTYFLISQNRLPSELRNMNNLTLFLKKNFSELLKEDWDIFLGHLHKNDFKKSYEKYSKEKYSNFLKLNFILSKSPITKENIGIVDGNRINLISGEYDLNNDEFYNMLEEEINLSRLPITDDSKIKIKEFYKNASLEIFFNNIPEKDLKKILSLESEIKIKLNIKNLILDLANKNIDDLKQILLNTFETEESAIIYSKTIIEGAKNFRNSLEELGIHI